VATLSEAAAEASVASGVSEPRRADDQRASTDSSSLISSEPLTRDTSTWFEVPEYTTIIASVRDSASLAREGIMRYHEKRPLG
jgi:hypothetical protein